MNISGTPQGKCPYAHKMLQEQHKTQRAEATSQGCPFGFDQVSVGKGPASRFGPSMPIVNGKVQIPSAGSVIKDLLVPHKAKELPPVKRVDLGLEPLGPKGEFVEAGNQWPSEAIHPLFPEFQALSGVAKAESISHYAHASRRTGKLDDLGEYGITASPQLIVDPNGMRWPFEADAQLAAARPREKNMHGRGSWGEIQVIPNPDPAKRLNYGILARGGVGDFRMSLGADQSTNVVGAALGIPLGPNDQNVESANLLMLAGPGPQLDDLDYFAKPLSTVAIPDETTPTLFKVLDHGFKASSDSGVRPGNHMFRYDQDGHFDETVDIPAKVNLVPNPKLTLHKLAELKTQSMDGVGGEAVREEYSNFKVEGSKVLDLALSEALLEPSDSHQMGSQVPMTVTDAEGAELQLSGRVVEIGEGGTKVVFEEPTKEAQMAVYQSMDLIWELSRRVKPGDHMYQIDVQMDSGEWKRDVARVQAESEFFPNEFSDHQRLYAHTERPNKTPVLRKMLNGIRWVTGNLAEALAFGG